MLLSNSITTPVSMASVTQGTVSTGTLVSNSITTIVSMAGVTQGTVSTGISVSNSITTPVSMAGVTHVTVPTGTPVSNSITTPISMTSAYSGTVSTSTSVSSSVTSPVSMASAYSGTVSTDTPIITTGTRTSSAVPGTSAIITTATTPASALPGAITTSASTPSSAVSENLGITSVSISTSNTTVSYSDVRTASVTRSVSTPNLRTPTRPTLSIVGPLTTATCFSPSPRTPTYNPLTLGTVTSPVEEITQEETNFIRLTFLVVKIAPQAVRQLFDAYNNPYQLNKKLGTNKSKLKKLYGKHIINKEQWEALYPNKEMDNQDPSSSGERLTWRPSWSPPGNTSQCELQKIIQVRGCRWTQKDAQDMPASSRFFDLTLMVLLLREMSGIPEPSTGWNKLPPATDNSLGADLARIKYHRNWLAHGSQCSVNNHDFSIIWKDLEEAIVNVGGQGFKTQVSSLMTTILDKSYSEMCRELKNMKYQDNIPNHIQYLLDQKLEFWTNEDETFVTTHATEKIKNFVEEHQFIMVTGPPGSGKSASVHYIALQLQKEGYRICPVSSPDKIVECWMPDEKQVFVVDDAFGCHTLDATKLSQWKTSFNDLKVCFQHSDMKILITVRTQFVNEKHIIKLLSLIGPKSIPVSDSDNCLTDSERFDIFLAHIHFNKRNDLMCMGEQVKMFDIYCFPLLCRIFAAYKESRLSGEDFFKCPMSVFKEEIEYLKCNDPCRYFCLLLCLLYDNNLDEEVLNMSNANDKDKKLRKTFLELCNLPGSTSRKEIHTQLDLLLGTYLIKEGGKYRFLHDIVQDAVICHMSSDFHEMVLLYCTSAFVKNRIRFKSFSSNVKGESFIFLEEDLESKWGRRLLTDIKEGSWYDVFTNECLQSKQGQTILANSLNRMDKKEVEFIMCKSVRKCKDRYINLENNLQLEVQKELLQNLNKDPSCAAFHWSVVRNLTSVIKVALQSINKDLQDKLNLDLCVLSLACIPGEKEIVRLFIDRRADLNAIDNFFGLSPLYVSCLHGHDQIVNLLIESGADVNSRCVDDETPLYISSKIGHEKCAKLLIDHGANVNQCTHWHGRTPLYTASKYGHDKIVKMLIDHKADINLFDRDGKSPLFLSCEAGYDKVLKLLIEGGADLHSDRYNFNGATPLYVSSRAGHYKTVKLLIDHSADIDKCGNYGETPLYVSAERGYEDIVKLLIDHSADVDKCNKRYGKTPLYVASNEGNVKVAKLLVDHGAFVNTCNKLNVSTPLFVAAENGNNEIVQLLIQHGADLNKPDKYYDKTPLFVSSEKGHYKVVKLLIDHDAVCNQFDKYTKETPLHVSAKGGHDRIVKLLIKKVEDVNIGNIEGETPLHLSSGAGCDETVKLLIENGASVNKYDNNERTPLYVSSMKGCETTVKLLISCGGDVHKCDSDGLTPLHASSEAGHDGIVKLLIKHGADVNKCDKQDRTPLFLSSKKGNEKTSKLLIDEKGDLNKCDCDGLSPLHAASEAGHHQTVKILIDHGADVNKCDKKNRTSLCLSSVKGCEQTAEILICHNGEISKSDCDGLTPLHASAKAGHNQIIKLLIDHGAEVNKVDKKGRTPVLLSCLKGYEKTVKLLIDNHGDCNRGDKDGLTPLHVSSDAGYYKIVKLLIDHGADVNKCDNNDRTPLFLSASTRYKKTVKLLIDSGSDINKCDRDGLTPLQVSSDAGHKEIRDLLIDRGADQNK